MLDKTLIDLLEPINETSSKITAFAQGAKTIQGNQIQVVEKAPRFYIYDCRGFKKGEEDLHADLLVPVAIITELPKSIVAEIESAFKDFELGTLRYLAHQGSFPTMTYNMCFGESKENCINVYAETKTGEHNEFEINKAFRLYGIPKETEETIIVITPKGIELTMPKPIRQVGNMATNPDHFLIKPTEEVVTGKETDLTYYDKSMGPFLSKKFSAEFLANLRGYEEGDYFRVFLHHIPGGVANATIHYPKWVEEDGHCKLTSKVCTAHTKNSQISLSDLLERFDLLKAAVRIAYADLGEYYSARVI